MRAESKKTHPIMLALCSMLQHTYHAQNYASIIRTGLVCIEVGLHAYMCMYSLGAVFEVVCKYM